MANAAPKIALVLDTRGLLCPGPVMKTTQAVKRIQVGEVLEILATDPGAKPDLDHWAKLTGNEFVGATEVAGKSKVYKIQVRRLK